MRMHVFFAGPLASLSLGAAGMFITICVLVTFTSLVEEKASVECGDCVTSNALPELIASSGLSHSFIFFLELEIIVSLLPIVRSCKKSYSQTKKIWFSRCP